MEPETITVDRRGDLGPEAFAAGYLRPNRPVVVPGAIDDWGALVRWDLDFFRDELGSRAVEIDGETFVLGDLIDSIEASTPANPAPYLRSLKIAELFPELLKDLARPFPFSRSNWPASRLLPARIRRLVSPELLLGGHGSGFPVLHQDTRHLHAFVAQVHGTKEFILFPPDQAPYLYPDEDYRNKSRIERVFDPDLERYPLLRKARSTRVTIGPGEVLFVPTGWWHTTFLPEPSISVTWNLANASNWREFVADSCAQLRRSQRPTAAIRAFGMYLRAVGVLQTMRT